MAVRAKIAGSVERRLLVVLEATGGNLAAACRAARVTPQAVRARPRATRGSP
jgi:hypothetical protein